MDFKELVATFAAKYGISNLDNPEGTVELDVDGVRVEILNDDANGDLTICAEIGHPPPDADGAFGGMMLQANFLLRATEGATLCQNPESLAYAIVRSVPLATADAETLGKHIESLVNQTENWRKVLDGIKSAEENTGGEDGDSHHEMISQGFMHV